MDLTEDLENMHGNKLDETRPHRLVCVQILTCTIQLFADFDCPFLFSFNPQVIMLDRQHYYLLVDVMMCAFVIGQNRALPISSIFQTQRQHVC
jgi:hypothetical protein